MSAPLVFESGWGGLILTRTRKQNRLRLCAPASKDCGRAVPETKKSRVGG